MDRVALILGAVLASAAPVEAASPDPNDLAIPPAGLAKARELVARLGSANFDERELAQDDLARMGRLALPALLTGLHTSASPEVRSRCRTLLPKAAAEDLRAKLATFLADTEGKFEHDLPGWAAFREVAGDGPAARAVFAGLLAESVNRDLVFALGGLPEDLGERVVARRQELYLMRFPRQSAASKEPSVADVAALMFAETQVASRFVRRAIPASALYLAPAFSAAVTDSAPAGRVYRAVVARWMATRDDAVSLHQAAQLGSELNLTREAAGAAAKLVRLKGAPWAYRSRAAAMIARLGARDQLPALEAAFGDDTVMRSVRVGGGVQAEVVEVQLRDTFLAAAVQLTGQTPAEYGFVEQVSAARNRGSLWHLPADKRAAAFERWKAWREQHPDAEKIPGDK